MYLVFDVGGTFIKYAWMTGDGQIIKKDKTPTPVRPEDTVEDLLAVMEQVYREALKTEKLQGLAVSLPGQIDVEQGIVYGGGGLKYMDRVQFGPILSARCDGIRVALENDGKCAALAEVFDGNAKDCQDACVLVFGTGIGGGVIHDRKVIRGRHILAGEVSFIFEGMTRARLGEIEQVAGVENMTMEDVFEKMDYLFGNNTSTVGMIHQVAWAKGLSPADVTGEMVYQWIDEGDEEVREIVEEMYFRIAKHCCNLHVILDPDVILIGGGISAEPRFVEGINRYVQKLKKVSHVYRDIRVDVCKHRNSSNLLGALFHFRQFYNEI